jgi:hypothetical protein
MRLHKSRPGTTYRDSTHVSPTQADAAFVYHIEDILQVYTRPYDPARPQLCMDEVNTQLLADTREPLPMEPGQPVREDYEYEREARV